MSCYRTYRGEYHLKNFGGLKVNIADELSKLNELFKSGVLSQEEFDEQKRRVLDSDNNGYIASEQHTGTLYSPPPPIYSGQPLPNSMVNQKYIQNMVNCKSCGMKIGKNADFCPYCGAKKRKLSGCLIAIIVMFVIVGGIGAIVDTSETEPNSTDATTEEPQLTAEEKAAAEKAEKEAEEKRIESIKNSIEVNSVYFGYYDYSNRFVKNKTDEVDGFVVRIDWNNLTDNTIKYANFTVKFFNTVGDPKGGASLALTGPYKKGQPGATKNYWGPWFVNAMGKVKLSSAKIEYMDGTIISISVDDIKYILKK
jgi:hypothetical protein